MKNITLPKGVTEIGEWVFWWCKSLENITIPDGVAEIGECAFYSCDSLKSITIPDSVTTIGARAFEDCGRLSSIIIPRSVTSIGGNAFLNSGMKTLYGYEGTYAETYANENGFKFYEIMESNLYYYAVDDDNNATIIKYKGKADSVNIPDKIDAYSVVATDNMAFAYCTGLKSITIPDSVTEIGEYTFYNCTSLESVKLSKTLKTIGDSAFEGTAIKSIEIPKSLEAVDTFSSGPFADCENLKTVTFENGTTKIVDYLFEGCTGLESITIPDGVTTIGYGAFSGCTSLKSITLPAGITEIGRRTFAYCTALKSITLPKSVVSIEATAFSNSGMETIYGYKGTYAETYANENGFKFYEITEESGISYESGYAYGIAAGTAVSEIEGATAVKDSKGNEIKDTAVIGTGCVITKDGKDYTVIVMGDSSGDGNINSTDFMQIRKSFLGTFKLDDAKKAAADVNGDGKINSTDFMQVRKHFLGTYNLYA